MSPNNSTACSIVWLDKHKRKHQSSAWLVALRDIVLPHKGPPVKQEMFHFMTSLWSLINIIPAIGCKACATVPRYIGNIWYHNTVHPNHRETTYRKLSTYIIPMMIKIPRASIAGNKSTTNFLWASLCLKLLVPLHSVTFAGRVCHKTSV